VPPFDLPAPTPILIFGVGEQVEGRVWLKNATGAEIKVTRADLTVDFPTGSATGQIPLPEDAGIPPGETQPLIIQSGLTVFSAPDTYNATVTLTTSAGNQAIPAKLVIAATKSVALAPTVAVFTGVLSSTDYDGSVVAVNRGNTAITVGPIPDEALLEVVSTPRALTVENDGTASVVPALATAPSGNATFTNPTPTIQPGGWAPVTFKLRTPAGLAMNRHYRVFPRIAMQRFAVDLLT
jgi:large exoprotein involved in heme utilization and adhesion